jgi:hypothetical protein
MPDAGTASRTARKSSIAALARRRSLSLIAFSYLVFVVTSRTVTPNSAAISSTVTIDILDNAGRMADTLSTPTPDEITRNCSENPHAHGNQRGTAMQLASQVSLQELGG